MEILTIETKGQNDIVEITDKIQDIVSRKGVENGIVNLFVIGSTASITTAEDDKNLYLDIKDVLETIAPYGKKWAHHKTWGDDNGAAHIRATLLGPNLSVPIEKGKLILGTWQKIVLLDFDTRERKREIVVSIIPDNL